MLRRLESRTPSRTRSANGNPSDAPQPLIPIQTITRRQASRWRLFRVCGSGFPFGSGSGSLCFDPARCLVLSCVDPLRRVRVPRLPKISAPAAPIGDSTLQCVRFKRVLSGFPYHTSRSPFKTILGAIPAHCAWYPSIGIHAPTRYAIRFATVPPREAAPACNSRAIKPCHSPCNRRATKCHATCVPQGGYPLISAGVPEGVMA
jgi:hypothetical protein